MFQKDVTVCIPTYNGKKYLPYAINSVVHAGCTVLIVDNASTDGTSQLCQKIAAQHSNVEYYRAETNEGGLANMIRCADFATTPFVFLMRDCDFVREGAAEKLYEALQQDNSAVLAAGQQFRLSTQNELYKRNSVSNPEMLRSNNPGIRAIAFFESLYFIPFYGLYKKQHLQEILIHLNTTWKNIFASDLLAILYITLKYKWFYVKDSIYICRDKFPATPEGGLQEFEKYAAMFKMSEHERQYPHNRCGRALVKLLDEHLNLPPLEKEHYTETIKTIFAQRSKPYNNLPLNK